MVRTLVLVASLVLAPNRIDVTPPDAKADGKKGGDITGYYTCSGQESNGMKYTGIAVISKAKEVYLVQWNIGVGATFIGVGIRQQDTLAVSWAMPGDKGVTRGINMYRIEDRKGGPVLTGRWATLPGDGSLKSETLSFLKRLGEE